ncbi:MAG: DUF4366 domain-containing protein [Lachnospiraceae bacterium]|nr:DUF4366 domain-containing protein [Lachnospiraceae bacterium]
MGKKIKRMLMALAAALSLVSFVNPVTALAYTGETEETVLEETFIEETETEATETDSSFSVSGNGEVLDDITDDSTKEFFTITTENGNTYFLVIDRSSSTENVYMLSMIDEYDLQDFLEETGDTDTTTSSQGSVVLEEQTQSAEEVTETETPVVTEDEDSSGNMSAVLLVLVLAAAAGGGAYFYFKVYKPKQEADAYESENMEIGDGLETINEDEAGYDETDGGDDGSYDEEYDSGYDDGYGEE